MGTHSSVTTNFGVRVYQHTWDFDSPADYIISDSTKISLIGGAASLQQIDLDHNSLIDFNGTHLGTYYNDSKLAIKESTYAEHHPSWTPEYSSLIDYWNFNNNYIGELSGNTFTVTHNTQITNNAKIGPGAVLLDGTDDSLSLTLTGADIFNFSDDFSVSIWISHDYTFNSPHDGLVKPINLSCNTGYILNLWINDSGIANPGQVRFFSYNGSSAVAINNYTLSDESFHHYVFVKNGNDTFAYIDGNYIGSVTIPSPPSTSCSSIKIDRGLKGRVDDLAIWKKALSSVDVATIYNRQSAAYADDTSLTAAWTPQYTALAAYWRMDGNWRDSVGSNNGTAAGNATFISESKVGSHSGIFDGTGDYIFVNDHDDLDLNLNSGFTTMAWVYVDALGNTERYISKSCHNGGWTNSSFLLSKASSDQLSFNVHDTGSTVTGVTSGASNLSLGWNHIVGVYTGSQIAVYLDGELRGSVAYSSGVYDGTLGVVLGARHDGVGCAGFTQFAEGKIDDAAIWKVALTSGEIKLIYHRQKQKYSGLYLSPIISAGTTFSTWTNKSWVTELPFLKELPGNGGIEDSANYSSIYTTSNLNESLEGLWHFNETLANTATSGNDFEDTSGNHRHMYELGSVSYGKEGVLGNAILLSSGQTLTSNFNFGAINKLTFSAWVKNNSASITSVQGILYKLPPVFELLVSSTGSLASSINNSSGWHSAIVSSPFSDWNEWHHVVAVYNGSNVILYRDGNQIAISGAETGNVLSNNSALRVGWASNGGSSYWDGSIDEVAVWSRALDLAEIKQIFRRGANRLKLQIRSCDDTVCSGEYWLGPDGTENTWFSELNNCDILLAGTGTCDFSLGGQVNVTSPTLLFSDFTSLTVSDNQYFQYRILMESSDESLSPTFPTLTSLSIGPTKYYGDSPSIVTLTGPSFVEWVGLTDSILGGCSVTYQASIDQNTWYFHDGTTWALAASSTDSNSAAALQSNTNTFGTLVGAGKLYLRAFLNSDSQSSCTLSSVSVLIKR